MTEDTPPQDRQPPGEEPQRGSMRFQDADSTTAREPTLGEQRARRKALVEEERLEAERAEAERKAGTRRKLLIGSGVTVGLVGVVAAWYVVGTPKEVSAVCTDSTGTVVDENDCDDNYVASQGGHYDSVSGFWILPLATGGFSQYRYNYGGTGTVGAPVAGGSYTKPSGGTTVKTGAGKTVQRGGFGISGKSSSGGSGGSDSGKSGGS